MTFIFFSLYKRVIYKIIKDIKNNFKKKNYIIDIDIYLA